MCVRKPQFVILLKLMNLSHMMIRAPVVMLDLFALLVLMLDPRSLAHTQMREKQFVFAILVKCSCQW